MSNNLVRYTGFSLEELDKLDNKVDELSGSEFLKVEEGETVIRILPGINGTNPFRVTAMHYVDAVPGLDKTVVFACPRVELKEPCAVCAKSAELASSGSPIERERAKKLEAGLRVYCNVIDRAHPDAGVRVYAFGKQVWEQLKAIRKSKAAGGDFTMIDDTGFDIIIFREGTGKNDTKYKVAAARDNSPALVDELELQALLETMPGLDRHVEPVVPQELVGLFNAAQLRAGTPTREASTTAPRAAGRLGAGLMTGARGAPASEPQRVVTTTGRAVDDAQVVDDDDFGPTSIAATAAVP